MPPPPLTPWTAEIWLRMRRHFLLKLAGTSAFTWLFFIGYFALLGRAEPAPTVMPMTALDASIPFQPAWLVAYLSLWVYVGLAPGLQRNLRDLLVYTAWVNTLCGVGLAIFYVWPSAVPVRAPDAQGFPGFALLHGVDAAGNACPSMHVAAAIFSALWIDHVLRFARAPWWARAANGAWFLAIAWSTLAIKQHVLLDVAGGALLGAAFAAVALAWRPERRHLAG